MPAIINNIKFEPVNISVLKSMRMSYFYEIKLSQELFLEWQVKNGGQYYKIYNDKSEIGYFILSKDDILVEFYLVHDYIIKKEEVFSKILQDFNLKKVYCKTFDSILLICSQLFSRSSKIIGTIFRDYISTLNIELEPFMKVRIARETDIDKLLQYDSNLYETPEELKYMVHNKMVYMFEKESVLIGCGFLIRVLSDRKYYDIGMWVNPEFRNQGYASLIISHLKKLCFSHGYIPVCGCALENIASRKALERNGFISKHAIIEFEVSYHES